MVLLLGCRCALKRGSAFIVIAQRPIAMYHSNNVQFKITNIGYG